MKSFALKSRYWCSRCNQLQMPNEGSVCGQCNVPMESVELIAHRYVFHPKNRVGKGVIKVWDQRMGRWTVVKFPQGKRQYRNTSTPSEAKVSRIDREMLIQAQLEHPAIVSAYDVVEDPDYGKGLVMGLVEGLSLYKLVSKHGPLRVRASVEIIRDITGAVHYMHKKGIVHRDLTPGNIIIEGKKPVLIDFGLAKLLKDNSSADPTGYLKARTIGGKKMNVTAEGEILGTPLFMAPEQVEGSSKRIDERSDIYGLGATLYYIVTGSPPFEGKDVLSVISQVLHRDPLSPSQRNSMVDPPLEAIIQKAMAKEREGRFQSAESFHESLQLWMDGEDLPSDVYQTPFSVKFSRKMGKMRKVFWVVFVLLGFSITVGSYLYLLYVKSQYSSKLPKDKAQLALLIEDMGEKWGVELVEDLEKKGKYQSALKLVEWLQNKQEKSKNPSRVMEKKLRQWKEKLQAKREWAEKLKLGKQWMENGDTLRDTNVDVALYYYLKAFDSFKEMYRERREKQFLFPLNHLSQQGEFFEKKNTKKAFLFYQSMLDSLKQTFGKSKDPNIQKKIFFLKIKTKNLQEKIK